MIQSSDLVGAVNRTMYYDQAQFDIRFEWGEAGVLALAPHCDVTVIVDVLSFTTSVEIATANGAIVYPFHGREIEAEAFAARHDALLAAHSRTGSGYTLSPSSLVTIPAGTRLVLPSLNGSQLTYRAYEIAPDQPILAACLRNAAAVAHAISEQGWRRVGVIAAGERWPGDHTLRPAIEDLAGAGAVIARLPGTRSPEADTAVATFDMALTGLPDFLRHCSSGRELIERGFGADVELAAQLDVANGAPCLVDLGFVR